MKTYFDFNPTNAELGRFSIKRENIDIEKEILKNSPDDNLYMTGMLFAGRGNMKKANKYWSKIKNKSMLSTLVEDF